jgi:hypothetical protein
MRKFLIVIFVFILSTLPISSLLAGDGRFSRLPIQHTAKHYAEAQKQPKAINSEFAGKLNNIVGLLGVVATGVTVFNTLPTYLLPSAVITEAVAPLTYPLSSIIGYGTSKFPKTTLATIGLTTLASAAYVGYNAFCRNN